MFVLVNKHGVVSRSQTLFRAGRYRLQYKRLLWPTTSQVLSCKGEDGNIMDSYVVAIMKGSEIIGHIPRKMSAACYVFIRKGGILTCIITDSNHQYSSDLLQGGLQIPCKLVFESHNVELIRQKLESFCSQLLQYMYSLNNQRPSESLNRYIKQRLSLSRRKNERIAKPLI